MHNFNVGELFIIGFHGTKLDNTIRSYLAEFSFGGIILFSRNISCFHNWRELTAQLQNIRSSKKQLPYFIAVDEEGGTVSRMPDESYTLPGARALAETRNTENSFLAGMTTGKILGFHGCNLNLAPVLDVNVNPLNPGIGIRSFGSSKDAVLNYALEFMRGLTSAGIFSCAKHFPGKGDILKDSHKTTAVCNASGKDIFSVHMEPFRQAVLEQISFVMTSHAVYPAIDDKPATLSKIFLKNILRDNLGFKGLIISDDLEMGAMSGQAAIGQTAYEAIMAGCDMLLICHSQEKQKEAYDYISQKLKSDKKLKARCEESYHRIIEIKKGLPASFLEKVDLSVVPELSVSLAGNAVKVVRDKLEIFPLDKSVFNKKVMLAGTKFRSDIEVEIIGRTPYDITDFYNELKMKFKNLDILTWDLNPEKNDIYFENYDLIFLCVNNACLFDGQKKLVNEILSKFSDKTILIAVKNPEDIAAFENAQTAIAVYGYNKSNIMVLKRILTG